MDLDRQALTGFRFSDLRKNLVDDSLELEGPLMDLPVGVGLVGSRAETLIREVEGDQQRQAEHVARGSAVGRRTHFLVDVRRQLRDVALFEVAAYRIPLTGDFDGDDAAQIASSCSSMSAGRSAAQSDWSAARLAASCAA